MSFNNPSLQHLLFIVLLPFGLAACSSAPEQPTASVPTNSDPLESINRPIWRFTWDYADKYFTKPVANAYATTIPKPVRAGVYNMALNLNEPATIINNLLQAKFGKAAENTGRFVLNSTIGLLGIFDPASDIGWHREEEEFGEVLASYGVGEGAYIVVPVAGPSSVRDEAGDLVDGLYWPMAIIDFWPNLVRLSVLGLEQRTALVEKEPLINDAVDDYIFVKNAYRQAMEYKIYDGNPPIKQNKKEEADLDAYLDELDF